MRNSKKGSYIMEASIVLPITILVVITVVLIIMFFYSQVAEQSRMHIYIRGQAAAITEKTIYIDDTSWDGTTHKKNQTFGGYVYGKGYLIMSDKGILKRKGTYVAEGTSHIVDPVKYVRYCSLVKGVIAND